MPDPHESYAARYEAPGKAIVKASKSSVRSVRRLVAEVVRDVETLPDTSIRKLAPIIGRAHAELEKGLAKWLETAPAAGDRFTAHQMRLALRQLRAARQAILDISPKLRDALFVGNVEAAGLSSRMLSREIARLSQLFGTEELGLARLNLPMAAELVERNSWLLSRFDRSIKRYGERSFTTIRNKLAVGVLKQENMIQLITRVAGYTPAAKAAGPGWAKDMAKGLIRGPAYNAERLIRTELANAYNAHHQESIHDFAEDQAVGGQEVMKRWDASADRRCALCDAVDGEQVPTHEPFSSGDMYPPLHPNCRCVAIPWMDHWPEIKQLKPLNTETTRRFAPGHPTTGKPVVTPGGTAVETRRALRQEKTSLTKGSARPK